MVLTLLLLLLLLLTGASMPGGSQCCSGPGSGIPGQEVFTYLSKMFENVVIRNVNINKCLPPAGVYVDRQTVATST